MGMWLCAQFLLHFKLDCWLSPRFSSASSLVEHLLIFLARAFSPSCPQPWGHGSIMEIVIIIIWFFWLHRNFSGQECFLHLINLLN